jgi:hypothetical protein
VYCGNNPVMFADPWGLRTIAAVAGLDPLYNGTYGEAFMDDIKTFQRDNPDDTVYIIDARWYIGWNNPVGNLMDKVGEISQKEPLDAFIYAGHSYGSGLSVFYGYGQDLPDNQREINTDTSWSGIKFNKDANIKLMGCNAGGYAGYKNFMTVIDEETGYDWLLYFDSIAQDIANKTGVQTWAYVNYTTQKKQNGGYYQKPINNGDVGKTYRQLGQNGIVYRHKGYIYNAYMRFQPV